MTSKFLQSIIVVASKVEIDDIGQSQRKANGRNHDGQDSVRELIGRKTELVNPFNDFMMLLASFGLVEEGGNSADDTVYSKLV